MGGENVVLDAAERGIARAELVAFDVAEKVPAAMYDGPCLWPGRGCPSTDWGNGWFSSVGEVIRRCARSGRDLPPFLWTGHPFAMAIDADEVIDNALSDHHEDARDCLARGAVKALQAVLDAWVAEYGADVKTWDADMSRAIVFGDEDRDTYRRLRAEADADRQVIAGWVDDL